jgi:hypothetical protein
MPEMTKHAMTKPEITVLPEIRVLPETTARALAP